jgi:hypothetical protein
VIAGDVALAATTGGSEIFVLNLKNGKVVDQIAVDGGALNAAVSPDGTSAVAISPAGSLAMYSVNACSR